MPLDMGTRWGVKLMTVASPDRSAMACSISGVCLWETHTQMAQAYSLAMTSETSKAIPDIIASLKEICKDYGIEYNKDVGTVRSRIG